MRNLLALVGLIVVVVVGVGLWRGWHKIGLKTDSEGNLDVSIQVDTKKIGADASNGLKNAGEQLGHVAESLKNKEEQREFFGIPLPPKPTPSPASLPVPGQR